MSLDITIKERQEFHCPSCGLLVTGKDISEVYSGGRVWFRFLEAVEYTVPHEKGEKPNDWYGLDMMLDKEQAKKLAQFVVDYQPNNYNEIEDMVARALMRGNKVVINADW